jgi:hypothetical protein
MKILTHRNLYVYVFLCVIVPAADPFIYAQSNDIGNRRTLHTNNQHWQSYQGQYDAGQSDYGSSLGYWFGGAAGSTAGFDNHLHYTPGGTVNDIFAALNTQGSGSVTILQLDDDRADYNRITGRQQRGTSNDYDPLYTRYYHGPAFNQYAWRTANSGTVTVGSGNSLSLSANYASTAWSEPQNQSDTATTTPNSGTEHNNVPLDWQFRFDGGSTAKTGNGKFDVNINAYIRGTFAGSQGTLQISGHTGDQDHWAQVDVQTQALLNGGGTMNVTRNTVIDNVIENGYTRGNTSFFTVVSGDFDHNILRIGVQDSRSSETVNADGASGHGGTTGKGYLTGSGFNNLGNIFIYGGTTASALDNITNIGMTVNGVGADPFGNAAGKGKLTAEGTLQTGTTAAVSILNVAGNGSLLSIAGTFQAGTVSGADNRINIREAGQLLSLSSSTLTLGDAAGSHNITVVADAGSNITADGTLITGGSGNGSLYVYNSRYHNGDQRPGSPAAHEGAGHVSVTGNHVIARNSGSVGRDIIDGQGTLMEITQTLTVGESGHAGGLYEENRYSSRFQSDPGDSAALPPNSAGKTASGHQWFDNPSYTTGTVTAGSDALTGWKTGTETGNDPGLAITRSAVVKSQDGIIGKNTGGSGYAVIDNQYGGTGIDRTRWEIGTINPAMNGTLTIGEDGEGWVRVLNGALLQVGDPGNSKGLTVINGGGSGHLYVIGSGVDGGDVVRDKNGEPIVKLRGGYDVNYRQFTGADAGMPLTRTELISNGPIVLGYDAATYDPAGTNPPIGGRGTLRIDDGAYASAQGLYAGLQKGSQGEVSTKGAGTWFDIYPDTSSFAGQTPQGSSLFSSSDLAMNWIHGGAAVRLNGNAMITHGAVLHLGDHVPGLPQNTAGIFDAMKDKVTVMNGRAEGDGTITGERGVFITHDDEHNPNKVQTTVDPGQGYAWESRDETPAYYGTLTFGDSLRMTGNVRTNFDVNSGYFAGLGSDKPYSADGNPANSGNPDLMKAKTDTMIVRKSQTSLNSGNTAQVVADLSGTLRVRARLTDYYGAEGNKQNPLTEFMAVATVGDTVSGKPGVITSLFDQFQIVPKRFFEEETTQEIRKYDDRLYGGPGYQSDALWITMKRKNDPFSSTGKTFNEKSVGAALDHIYQEQIAANRKDWLPVLRGFWSIENDETFLASYRVLSGEVRAHSLLLPVTDQFLYAHHRMEFRDCPHLNENSLCFSEMKPCRRIDCGADRNAARFRKDMRLWGSWIGSGEEGTTDGNAAAYRFSRYGLAAGIDRPFLRKESYLGVMFTVNEGTLNTYRAKAEDHDFAFGLYHGMKFGSGAEWKNYAGMGIQHYKMRRELDLPVTELEWDSGDYMFKSTDQQLDAQTMRSTFAGYSMSASTEIARPFCFGKCRQWMFRPYTALDLQTVWQNKAGETWNTAAFPKGSLAALNFQSASLVRLYGRPGFMLERNGDRWSVYGGLAYAFLLGGRGYTDVDNCFQIGGGSFNIRGVDDGSDGGMWNVGGSYFIGKKKQNILFLDYRGTNGDHHVLHSGQAGYQHHF